LCEMCEMCAVCACSKRRLYLFVAVLLQRCFQQRHRRHLCFSKCLHTFFLLSRTLLQLQPVFLLKNLPVQESGVLPPFQLLPVHGFMVQQFRFQTLQHCNIATLQHCNSATVQQCNSATLKKEAFSITNLSLSLNNNNKDPPKLLVTKTLSCCGQPSYIYIIYIIYIISIIYMCVPGNLAWKWPSHGGSQPTLSAVWSVPRSALPPPASNGRLRSQWPGLVAAPGERGGGG
jgi:hypothetical protein